MKKEITNFRLILILILLLQQTSYRVFGQDYLRKENYIWLNSGMGIDFNVTPPINHPSMSQVSGYRNSMASVCDGSGNLLFYTDGNIVWDKNNNVMQNGWDINNNGNLTPNTCFIEPIFGLSSHTFDGTVIIPMPGSSHKYYIFCSPQIFQKQSLGSGYVWVGQFLGKLFCTVVDMEGNNGLGVVDENFRGVTVANSMAGNLEAITGTDCNEWLLGFGSNGRYKAFKITNAGIDTTPAISILPPPLNATVGELLISPNQQKAVMANGSEVQLSDFNPITGQFSNAISIGAQECRTIAFSPNSELLYLSGLIGLRQYQVNSLTTPLTLLTNNNITAYEQDAPIHLGPDGKLYFSYCTLDTAGFGVICYAAHIKFPNVFGTGCQMELMSNPLTMLMPNSFAYYQFPNTVPTVLYDTISSIQSIPICFGKPAYLNPGNPQGTDFHWMVKVSAGNNFIRQGSDTASTFEATTPGIYAVQYYTSNPCQVHRDTFYVTTVNYSLYLGADTQSCDGTPITLSIEVPDAQYLWSDNSTEASTIANESGNWWIQVTKDGCTASDSIRVGIFNIAQNLGSDTTLCLEDMSEVLQLKANMSEGAVALWNTGSTESIIYAQDTGLYWVQVTNGACQDVDSLWLHREYCDCPMLIPNAFTPNGDGKNDVFQPALPGFCPISLFKLQIFNRYGQRLFISYQPDKGWDGSINGKPADMGVYYYRLQMETGLHKSPMTRNGSFTLLR